MGEVIGLRGWTPAQKVIKIYFYTPSLAPELKESRDSEKTGSFQSLLLGQIKIGVEITLATSAGTTEA